MGGEDAMDGRLADRHIGIDATADHEVHGTRVVFVILCSASRA
jgi:hypothetical protein